LATEIERKFLVSDSSILNGLTGTRLVQGYIYARPPTVRVRIAGDQAFLTIKGPIQGISRSEFEYSIPVDDAQALLHEFCSSSQLEKTRYNLEVAGSHWEVDVFEGLNTGLVLAEIELETSDQPIVIPPWVGAEVSHDPRYYNSNLIRTPYSCWSQHETN